MSAKKETKQKRAGPARTSDDVTLEQLEAELRNEKNRQSFSFSLRSTIFALITVAAVAVLVAVLVMPVLQIYGGSMAPTLSEGDIVLSLKGGECRTGDIVAFYYNNNILVKRVVAGTGDWVDIAPDGTVYVNDVPLDEPYIKAKAFGETNITLPYQVPESRVFVLGDQRDVSIDSRNTAVGCVASEQLVGKIVFRVWPLSGFGAVR